MVATHGQSVAEPVEWPELDWNFRFGSPGTPDSPGQHRDGQPSGSAHQNPCVKEPCIFPIVR